MKIRTLCMALALVFAVSACANWTSEVAPGEVSFARCVKYTTGKRKVPRPQPPENARYTEAEAQAICTPR